MKVTDHVDTGSLLLSTANAVDNLYARMIDGRTIHQFLLFVAPTLHQLPMSRKVTLSPQPHDLHGLAFFEHLLSKQGHLAYDEKEPSSYSNAVEDSTKNRLTVVAKEFLRCCLEAELSLVGGTLKSIDAETLDEVEVLFSKSICWEFRRRKEFRNTRAMRDSSLTYSAECVLRLLSELEPAFLVQEMCAYWFPGWRRSLFIFESPLDFLGGPQDLRTLLASRKNSVVV